MTTEQRNQNVVDFLKSLYGQEPRPLRSYLTNKEARDLMGRCDMALSVTFDLDLRGYGCKWRNAVEDQIRAVGDPSDPGFWLKARTAFLEYGGEYKEHLRPERRD